MVESQNRILSPEPRPDDRFDQTLRPSSLVEIIGQKQVKENLSILIAAAKQRGEPLDHVLFYGPPGLGKTTLAYVLASEMGVNIKITAGPAVERAGDLAAILTNLHAGDVLFIDEIHRLSKVVEEFLYPAMENFKIDFVVDKGPYARTINFNLKPFTIIGATTRSGLLASPLRDRFGIPLHFEFYQCGDLAEILRRSAGKLNIEAEQIGRAHV
jgi:Holliday junction DNA helicase RuvB